MAFNAMSATTDAAASSAKRKHLPDAGALALLALLVALFFWPVILGRAWIPRGGGDLVSFIYPMYRFAAQSLSSGQLPLWNPYLYAGAPFIADNQSGLFYPFNLILFLLCPGFSYEAIEGLVIWHIFFAGASMYVCLRALQPSEPIGRPSALFGAIAYMFSDVFITHLGNLNLNAVAAWLPLAFLSLHRAMDAESSRSRLRWTVAGGAALGLSTLAGHGQSTFLIASFLGTYALLRTVFERKKWAIPLLLLVGLIAVATAALALLPALDSIRLTLRAEFNFERSTGYSLPWKGLLGLVAPGFFGRGAADFWGDWARVEYGYTGVIPLFLAAVALVTRPTRRNLTLGLAGILFLLLSLGPNAPLYPLIFQNLPIVPFQVPARFVLLVDFSLAILAAIGLGSLGRMGVPSRQRRWILGGTGVGALALMLLLIGQYRTYSITHPERQAQMLSAILIFLLFAVGSWVLILMRFRGKLSPRVFAWATFCWLAVDIIGLGWRVEIEPNDPTLGFVQDTPALAFLESDPGIHRIDIATSDWQPSLPQIENLYAIGGVYNPLSLSNYTVYYGSMGSRGSPLYNLLGVKYVIGEKDVPPGDTNFIVPVYDRDPQVNVFLNTRALPRAMVLFNAIVVSDHDAAFDAVHQGDFNPEQMLVLEDGQPLRQSPGLAEIHQLGYGLNHATFDVITDRTAYFLLTDIDHPHWTATVNGKESEILTADYAFRALFLQPGKHRIEFRFQPPSWPVGLALSSLTWAGIGVFAVSNWRYDRQQRRRHLQIANDS